MRNFEFNYQTLTNFSKEAPYLSLSEEELSLLNHLEQIQTKLNFPAINRDVGSFINFMMNFLKPKTIFEMGSGYGHSSFWYFAKNCPMPESVHLTEKRDDLTEQFENIHWPALWRDKIFYEQADAFDVLKKVDQIDFALIDGVKADYLDFLRAVYPKMSKGGVVLIDNSYWRGSFLDQELSRTKDSARKIKELHEFIQTSPLWSSVFVPYVDGLSILMKI